MMRYVFSYGIPILFGSVVGLFSTFRFPTYLIFALWLGILLLTSLWISESRKNVSLASIAAMMYSTAYIVTHGLVETFIQHAHETLIGWILMLAVYNGLSFVASWLFCVKCGELKKLYEER